jgi:hypothetical protein
MPNAWEFALPQPIVDELGRKNGKKPIRFFSTEIHSQSTPVCGWNLTVFGGLSRCRDACLCIESMD